MVRLRASIAAVGSVLLLAAPGLAAEVTKCRLTYSIKGWSVFYERSDGSGRITCSNGQQAAVNSGGTAPLERAFGSTRSRTW